MISRTPEQIRLYNARIKFQRDDAARLEYALTEGRQQGIQEGRQQGLLMGRITLLQQLLGAPQSTPDELSRHSETELNELIEQLQQQLRTRPE